MSEAHVGAQDAATNTEDWLSISFLVDQKLAEISTAAVVKIVKAPYDKNGNPITPGSASKIGYVDVQPMVNQLDGNGNATPHGTVYRLSYHRYQSGNGAFISDPVVGDIGKMVVADRDTSAVRATDAVSNPGSRRKFDKADGSYYGCVQADAPKQWFAFTTDGWNLTDKHGNSIVSSSSGIVITDCNGNKITMASGSITIKAGQVLMTNGGSEHFVLTNGGSGVSTVAKADS